MRRITIVLSLWTAACGGSSKPALETPPPAAPTATACPEPVETDCSFADDLDACQAREDAELKCLSDPACKRRCYDPDGVLEGARESIRANPDNG